MVLHSDLQNVVASLAKFVSGSSNELRKNLSNRQLNLYVMLRMLPFKTSVTYLHCSYVEPIGPVINCLLRCYAFQFTLHISFAHAMFSEVILRGQKWITKMHVIDVTSHQSFGIPSTLPNGHNRCI